MIKKGSKIVFKKPLKVLEVRDGDFIRTVVIGISYRVTGKIISTDEIEIPRSMVKEFRDKAKTGSTDNLYVLAERLYIHDCLQALEILEDLVLDFNELEDNEKWNLIETIQDHIKDLKVKS